MARSAKTDGILKKRIDALNATARATVPDMKLLAQRFGRVAQMCQSRSVAASLISPQARELLNV